MLSGHQPAPPAKELLDSWKEIAVFLNRGVRTVQRWEREENLPVHGHQHLKRGTVFASSSEVSAWLNERDGQTEPPPSLLVTDEQATEGAFPDLTILSGLVSTARITRLRTMSLMRSVLDSLDDLAMQVSLSQASRTNSEPPWTRISLAASRPDDVRVGPREMYGNR